MPAPVNRPSSSRRAFTLLEVVLAMFVIGLLVAGLAGISSVSLKLGQSILDAQTEEASRDAFDRLMRENLMELPQDAPLYLADGGIAGGGQMLVIEKAGGLFPVAGVPLIMDSVVIETRRDRSGLFAVNLLYYAGRYWQDLQNNVLEEENLVPLVLRDGLEQIAWRFYDAVKEEWVTEWEEGGRRPHSVELIYRFAGEDRDHRVVVWIPRMQTSLSTGGSGVPAGGNPDAPGGDGNGSPSGGPGGGADPARPGVRVDIQR